MRINHENKNIFQAQLASLGQRLAEGTKTKKEREPSDRAYSAITTGAINNEDLANFKDYLASIDKEEEGIINARAQLLGAFASQRSTLILPETPTVIGNESDIYIDRSTKRVLKHALRPRDDMPAAAHIDSLLLTGIRVQGRNGFEQVHAASFDEAAVITGLAKGEMLSEIPADRLLRILHRDGRSLIELVQTAYALGVGGDIHAENIMVHKSLLRSAEFTLIDPSLSEGMSDEDPIAMTAGLIEREDIDEEAMRGTLSGKR